MAAISKEQMRSAILAAIKELNDRRGSTATEIKKHVKANRPDGEQWQEATFKLALKDLDEGGDEVVKSGARYALSSQEEASVSVEVRSTQPRHENMLDLWRNDQLCDAEVVSSDGRSFKAHRLVLAANSDYMRALLATDRFKDSRDCPIQLSDVSSSALEHILEWMYAGKCKISSVADVAEVLEAASRLQCQDLMKQLESATLDIIDKDSCLGLWDIAERLNLEKLNEEAKMIALRNFDKFASTEDFNELPLARLVELVRDDGLSVGNEEEVFTSVLEWAKAQDEGTLSSADLQKLLSYIRFPRMDKAFVTNHVLTEPLLVDNPTCFRAVAHNLCDPVCERRRLGTPLKWEDVKLGVKVCIIDDVEELKRLCIEHGLMWNEKKAAGSGTSFIIDWIKDESRFVGWRNPIGGGAGWFPYTALRFAK